MNNEQIQDNVKIKIIGIGGAGNNAINLLLDEDIEYVEKDSLWIANTDIQDLNASICPNKIPLGNAESRGFGAGGDPKIGAKLAEESHEVIKQNLVGTDILILSAGLGGGTGTGALPVIAKIAKDLNILTLALVTTPFELIEGSVKYKIAQNGLNELKKYVDTYVVISNEKLALSNDEIPFKEALKYSNTILKNAIKIICEIINVNGLINIDFNDLKETLKNAGESIIGLAKCSGNDKISKAVNKAIQCQLWNSDVKSCNKLLINFHLDSKGSIKDVNEASKLIDNLLNINENQVNKIIGIIQKPSDDREDFFQINLIATGINQQKGQFVEKTYETASLDENYEEENDDNLLQEDSSKHESSNTFPGFWSPNSEF